MKANKSPTLHPCLQKLEQLKSKVQESMQIKENANYLNKYRVQFEITQPATLVGGELQQHQIESLEWMINLAAQQANGILADDMGLGKTIQAISYLAYLREENGIRGKHLIVCPKAVSKNWIRELNKWFPSSNAVLLLSTEEERQACLKKIVAPKKFDILVTTYEGVKKCIYPLSRISWETLIIDEAHKIKNAEAQNFQALSYLSATFKLLLTGTPLSNNLKQLWCLLNFIMPSIFYDPELFQEIEEATQTFEGTEEQKMEFRVKAAKYFHGIINPYFKRRAKKDLQLGLPPKTEKTLFVPLSKMQLQMYRNYLNYGNVYGKGQRSYRHSMIPRKICLHPYLFQGIYPEQEVEFGEHALENCGKLKVVDKLLKKLLKEDHKVLIFSQFTMMLDILEEYCLFRGFRYCRLDGNTDINERQQFTNQFNTTNKYQIFMLSTRAGGLGINLTGADRVIIYDIDWNPQNDIQAMDRAYRIGQKRPVHVYKLITEFTIEERISDFQKYKLVWDELVIQKGAFMAKKREDPFKNLTVESLAQLGKGDIFRLQIEESDKTIQEIMALGEEKDRQKSQKIHQQLKRNMDNLNISKFNPFEEENEEETYGQTKEEVTFIKRRNYDMEKRQKSKFDRSYSMPAFKFYIQAQKIRDLQFEIHMELKRDNQSELLIKHLQQLLENAKKAGKFDQWSEEEYQMFVEAHQLYLKEDYQQIAELIKTKTAEEVKAYSTYFFEKAPNNDRFNKQLKKIQLGQANVKMKIKNEIADSMLDKNSRQSKQNEQSEQITSELYKTRAELKRQVQIMQKIEKQKKNNQEKSKIEEEEKKKKKQEEKAERERKKEEEKRNKQAEKQKKAEEQQLAKQKKEEEKKAKAEKYQQLLLQRKQKKEKEEQQRAERQRQREEDRAKKREERQYALQAGRAKRIAKETTSLLKKIERDSASSKTKHSNSSKQTDKKSVWMSGNLHLFKENPLQIVTVHEK